MEHKPVSYQQLETFKQWLGLDDPELERLDSLKPFFTDLKEEFARSFYDFFVKIPEAKFIIDHQEKTGYLLEAWAHWFESLFSARLDQEFLKFQWTVGIRHVEVNLDQRFSNLGFAVVREFCQKHVLAEFSPREAGEILRLVNKMIDFCILVETAAYLEGSVRCDFEVMKGVADRIRNPLTVIGGHISRLMKKSDVTASAYPVYEFIFSQSSKCERMLTDIKTYMDIFDRESSRETVSLQELLDRVTGALLSSGLYGKPHIEIDIQEQASRVLADPEDMRVLFQHLIENSLEALEEKRPYVRITSTIESAPPHSVLVEIFNAGIPIREDEREKIFSPFYSTKPAGTGFGLSIALRAARKNMGRIRLEPVRNEGTRVVLSLPRFE